MTKARLLERINQTTSTGVQTNVHQSIVNNLINILRTQENTVPIRDDFGMPFYHDFPVFNDTVVQDLIADVTYQIINFEPRLHDVDVECKVDGKGGFAKVLYTITAFYVENSKRQPFKLKLEYDNRGRLQPKA